MNHGPGTLRRIQCQIQRIVANYPDRCQRCLHSARTIMGIGKNQIRRDSFSQNNELLWHSCQKPYPLSFLQRSGSLVTDSLSQKRIRKSKGFLILHYLVTICDHSQNFSVTISYIDPVACNQLVLFRIRWFLQYPPIQLCQSQSFPGLRSFCHHGSQSVPWFLSCVKHRFYICCHRESSSSFIFEFYFSSFCLKTCSTTAPMASRIIRIIFSK